MSTSDGITTQKKVLAIMVKCTAVPSIFGSCYIVAEVLRSPRKRSKTYHRLLLMMSLSDILSSTAIFIGSWAIPEGTEGVYLAVGTEASCQAQGFFIQLGIITPLYNGMLAVYYLLTVNWGWKERRLKQSGVEKYLHGGPLIWGFGTAIGCAAAGIYGNATLWCWLGNGNPASNILRYALYYGPVLIMLVLTTSIMLGIYLYVRKQEKALEKYDFKRSIDLNPVANATAAPDHGDHTSRPSWKGSMFFSSVLTSKVSKGEGSSGEDLKTNSQDMFLNDEDDDDSDDEDPNDVGDDDEEEDDDDEDDGDDNEEEGKDNNNNESNDDVVKENHKDSDGTPLEQRALPTEASSATIKAGTTRAADNDEDDEEEEEKEKPTTASAATISIVDHNPAASGGSMNKSDRFKRRANAVKNNKRSKRVMYQSLWYILAFYLSFAFACASRITGTVTGKPAPFPLLLLFSIFFPMQGFFNFLVYMRPRFLYKKSAGAASNRSSARSSASPNPATVVAASRASRFQSVMFWRQRSSENVT